MHDFNDEKHELRDTMDNTGKLFGDDLLKQIRERFCHVESDPATGPRIYLENAGGGLTLRKVVDLVAQQTALPDNAGRENVTSKEIESLLARGREDLASLLGARSGVVVCGESTTGNAFRSIGAIIASVPGGNVVTTNLDHPAIYDSTRQLAERYGKEWRVAGLSRERGVVEPKSIAAHVDADTSLLALIHSSNITGMKNDVAAIIEAARAIKPDLYVLLDGAQHGPHSLVDVEELGCDVYLVSSYKLFSKIGASGMYLSDRAARLPHDKLLGKPETAWELGTREQAGYGAWSEVVDYLCWLGGHFGAARGRREGIAAAMQAIELHEGALTSRMLWGVEGVAGLLDMPGVTVYCVGEDLTHREPCVILNVRGRTSSEVVSYLGENGIRVHNRVSDAYSRHTLEALGIEECVRVSLSHYNSPGEVDTFLEALRDGPGCAG